MVAVPDAGVSMVEVEASMGEALGFGGAVVDAVSAVVRAGVETFCRSAGGGKR